MSSPASNPEYLEVQSLQKIILKKQNYNEPISDPTYTPNNKRVSQILDNSNSFLENNYVYDRFYPSIISLFMFGILMNVIAAQYNYLGLGVNILIIFVTILMWEWITLYGSNLCREERFVKDYKNNLSLTNVDVSFASNNSFTGNGIDMLKNILPKSPSNDIPIICNLETKKQN